MSKFIVFESRMFPGEWLWKLVDSNGKDVIGKNGFPSEVAALDSIKKIKKCVSKFTKVEVQDVQTS